MDHLSDTQISSLRARLDGEIGELRSRLAELQGDVADNPDEGPEDIEDAAAREATRLRARRLLAHARQRLVEVEAALVRIEDETYGICEDSDDEIPYARLALEPTTRYTVEAQAQREAERGVADRHGDEPTAY